MGGVPQAERPTNRLREANAESSRWPTTAVVTSFAAESIELDWRNRRALTVSIDLTVYAGRSERRSRSRSNS